MGRFRNGAISILAFGFGFVACLIFLLAFNTLYRGVWMVATWCGVVSLLFFTHPRLQASRQTGPFLALFGFVATAAWMWSSEPSPIRFVRSVERLPLVFLPFAVGAAILLWNRTRQTPAELRIAWKPAVLFCAMGWALAFFSGSTGGPDPMVRLYMAIFDWTHPQAETATLVTRKTIHFTYYGSLALTTAFLANYRFDLRKACLLGLSVALASAGFDEFRQFTSIGRTGSLWDICLDLLGMLFFLGGLVLTYEHSQRKIAANRSHK